MKIREKVCVFVQKFLLFFFVVFFVQNFIKLVAGNRLGSSLRRALKVALEFLSLSTSQDESLQQIASQFRASDVSSQTNVII